MDDQEEHVIWVQGWESAERKDHHSSANAGRHFREIKVTMSKVLKNIHGILESGFRKIRITGETRTGTRTFCSMNVVLDPKNSFIRKWKRFFLLVSAISALVDPLYLYIPVTNVDDICLGDDKNLETAATVLRSIMDAIYIGYMILRLHTGFWDLSQESGTRVLVKDSWEIARRYLSSSFLIDFLAVLPFPQVAIWFIIPRMKGSRVLNKKNVLKWTVLTQLGPRFIRIKNLYQDIARSSTVLLRASRTVAALNLFLYIYAGHSFCPIQEGCVHDLLYCDTSYGHHNFQNLASLLENCTADSQDASAFDFGIYSDALKSGVVQSRSLPLKILYCFWWALQNLSSLGQNLKTSTYFWEICFAVSIFAWGLVLFSLLIGVLQTHLLSSTISSEEIKTRWQNVEQWMSNYCLPDNLRKRIRRHERYRLAETKGVDVEDFLSKLPKDLRRDTKQHLGLALLSQVPYFQIMDKKILDAMCDRLKPALYTEDRYIVREGDPVEEMVFITRGHLISQATHSTVHLKAGDFCGEELFPWAFFGRSSVNRLPDSTRTVQTVTEVEAFALLAKDLKFVASEFVQFHEDRLHRRQPPLNLRYYSLQWRTWAACFIQAAWCRYRRKRLESLFALGETSGSSPSLGATIYASRFATNALRTLRRTATRNARVV